MGTRRDPNRPEKFADYDSYLDGNVWPSLTANDQVERKYVDDMPPQYAAAALAKLRRWAFSQYATELDCERYWIEVQRKPLARLLAARATSIEDFSEALEPARGYSLEQAGHIICRMALEGAKDEEDPMYLVQVGTRIVHNLYAKGMVVLRTER